MPKGPKGKTDSLDNRILAMISCERTFLFWTPPTPTMRGLKGRPFLLKRNKQSATGHAAYANTRELNWYRQRLKIGHKIIAGDRERDGFVD